VADDEIATIINYFLGTPMRMKVSIVIFLVCQRQALVLDFRRLRCQEEVVISSIGSGTIITGRAAVEAEVFCRRRWSSFVFVRRPVLFLIRKLVDCNCDAKRGLPSGSCG
jgi:hypothetical protein